MKMKFTQSQHREYVSLMQKNAQEWLQVFEGNTEFYSADYWDLLSGLWYAVKPIMVSEALKMMRNIKSPYTARKYLQFLIDKKLVMETKNPDDDRSMLVSLAPEMQIKLDKYFDITTQNLLDTGKKISKR